jgi:hypothetical protein
LAFLLKLDKRLIQMDKRALCFNVIRMGVSKIFSDVLKKCGIEFRVKSVEDKMSSFVEQVRQCTYNVT